VRGPRANGTSTAGLPDKLYFRIGEVAELIGVEPHVLRYWEREFRTIRPTKSRRGQRVYSRRDVETLARIRALLYDEGFTIAGAKRKLAASHGHGASSVEGEVTEGIAADEVPQDGAAEGEAARDEARAPEIAAPPDVARPPGRIAASSAETLPRTTTEAAPPRAAMPRRAREQLVALRDELRAFLGELESSP
jgi:DNA-binding transcriptional MerR regulator